MNYTKIYNEFSDKLDSVELNPLDKIKIRTILHDVLIDDMDFSIHEKTKIIETVKIIKTEFTKND